MDELRGTEILRHKAADSGWVAAPGQRPGVDEAIDRHIQEHFGPVDYVVHEIIGHHATVHVYVVAPTTERPYLTLVTSGMSELPMAVPEELGITPYTELMLALPANWPLPGTADPDAPGAWPIRLLKQTARMPHEYATWLGIWHSVPNGDPAEPYAPGTSFAGVVVTPMLNVPPEARVIEVGDGTTIDLLALIPLHADEMKLKLSRGTDALIAGLDRGKVSELLDPDRPSFA
ncbi:suppressor of fused domain protein [Kribbella antibiotica]|uniref:Suppressor of fused domain protein n=1 Tax=Kribbella antibiotica TaxID=190195 RepID=A0A4R4YIY9_9ACTN|nr:suppressor of fused domain protein [Kribbella antibiotica]TDD44885.1 suppressor of fused domain protein [Kribbella antibiotica]